MKIEADTAKGASEAGELTSRSPRELAWRRFKKNKVGIAALCTSLFFVSAAVFAPVVAWLVNVNPNERDTAALTARGETIGRFGGMSWNHPLGVEPGIGYDILARLIYGARISFLVAAIATLASISIGLLIGLLSGYFRGRTDSVLGRFTDFLLAFPSFFMIIALSAPMIARIEKSGLARDNSARVIYLIMVLALFGWPYFSRIMRSQALSLREREFVDAARVAGASDRRIIFKHILPNAIGIIVVVGTLLLSGAILAETALSYLGFGVRPPDVSLGLLISEYQGSFSISPWLFWWPGTLIISIALCINFIGDGLRDAFDPRQRRRITKRDRLQAKLQIKAGE